MYRYFLIAAIACVPLYAVETVEASYEQEFIITAYYSPQPNQCCYVTGGYESDKILNGQGHTAADGTSVYPGMIAAPSLYAFGTKVTLPGYGVFTVHDRGGAIIDLGNGIHRLDIWVGAGEEGLARALAFGVQKIKGSVHPVGSVQPDTEYMYSAFPGPPARLEDYVIDNNLMSVEPEKEERSYSVIMLQNALTSLGHFTHSITGYFGEKTQEGLLSFLNYSGLKQPEHKLTTLTSSYILAALQRKDAPQPLAQYIDANASKGQIAKSQRLLRFLGYYKGRTHGMYDENLQASILRFQQDHSLASTSQDIGAGRIGPLTMAALTKVWNNKLNTNKAEYFMAMHKIKSVLAQRNQQIDSFLGEGSHGNQVRILQALLLEKGFFPEGKANGHFGPLTEEAVLQYQLANGIVVSKADSGAGYVGPSTLMRLRQEQENELFQKVNASGWAVL